MTTTTPHSFVLLPGAWMGSWIYDGVADRLRAAGADAHAPTLPGLGPDEDDLSGLTLDAHVAAVVDVVRAQDLHDVVLVAHSYAGVVASGAADLVADRLAHLVFVDSGPFEDGMAFTDFGPPEAADAMRAQLDAQGRLPFPDMADLAQQASLAGLDDHAVATMVERARPQPFATYTQPVHRTTPWQGVTPGYERAVVVCTDGGVTLDAVRAAIASGVPSFGLMTDPDWTLHELATGHWPMLADPAALTEVLLAIAGP